MRRLIDDNIRYSILHGWQSLPGHLTSDLDIVVSPEDLNTFEETLARSKDGRLVQMLQHEASCFYFVLAVREDNKIRFIPVDVATDYRRNGHIFFSGEELLRDRRQWNGFWITSPDMEFHYLLVKKTLKSAMPDHQKQRLRNLTQELGDKSEAATLKLFGEEWGNNVISWIRADDWNSFESNLPHLKKALFRQTLKKNPFNLLRYWIPELRRILRRWRYPTGLFIAVLGPDGAGKSTLIKNLQGLLGPFRQTAIFHLRPRIFKRRTADSGTDPHGKPPHSLFLSLLKTTYYLIDYTIGYLFKVRPKLAKSTLVLFDRYYDDLLVDSLRYRYGGPKWLVHLARRLIPRPDLLLILDVPEERLLERKQEVSWKELRRQREAYFQLGTKLPNAIILDGSLSLEEVARNAVEVILECLHERYLSRRHIWFAKNDAETIRWLSSILSAEPGKAYITLSNGVHMNPKAGWEIDNVFGWFGLKDNRGYLIPLSSLKANVSFLSLYNAQNLKAKIAKRFLANVLKYSVSRFLLPQVHMLVRKNVRTEARIKILLLEHLKKVLKCSDLAFALSLGAPGVHRKPVIQLLAPDGRTIGYAKVGWNDATNAIVKNEAEILERLSSISFDSFTVPTLIYAGWWADRFICVESPPKEKTKSAPQRLTYNHVSVFRELANFHTHRMLFKESSFRKNLLQRIESIQNPYYRHALNQGVYGIEEQLENILLPFHLRHGDFTPWNMYLSDGKLFLFDWEDGKPEAPAGSDIFHFIFQTLWLLEERTPDYIYSAVVKKEMNSLLIKTYWEQLDLGKNVIQSLFLVYLLERLAFNASEQEAGFHGKPNRCIEKILCCNFRAC